MKLRKIISGGQTGADRAGLEIAKELGLETGGWAPKGYRTENGPDLALKTEFGLKEHSSPEYPPRTRLNILEVVDLGGTVIFGTMESGSALTEKLCKGWKCIYLVNPTAQELREWLIANNVEVLNVAGNRASKNPGVAEVVKRTIREALNALKD